MNNAELELSIADSYVVVWPRNCNDVPTVDLDIRPSSGVTIEIAMSAQEATELRDALTAAIERAKDRANAWRNPTF